MIKPSEEWQCPQSIPYDDPQNGLLNTLGYSGVNRVAIARLAWEINQLCERIDQLESHVVALQRTVNALEGR